LATSGIRRGIASQKIDVEREGKRSGREAGKVAPNGVAVNPEVSGATACVK